MSAARFNEPFLTGASIQQLLIRLKAGPRELELRQLQTDFHALHSGGRVQCEATLRLIETIGIIERKERDIIHLTPSFAAINTAAAMSWFTNQLLKWLITQGDVKEFVQALQFSEMNGGLSLDTLRVPWRLNHLRHLLREIGIFERDDVNVRHWRINPEYASIFLESAKNENRSQGRPMAPNELLRLQERLSVRGEEAEQWVLCQEKRRLADHPFLDLVRRISQSDVSAGYDIISFVSGKSISHDRYLEIKSYAKEQCFFWSEGEIECAKQLGLQYVLVLVDRQKFSESGYKPIEIPDPYNYFFRETPNGWKREPTDWRIQRTSN